MPIQNIEREENTKQDSIKPIVPANNSLFGVVGMDCRWGHRAKAMAATGVFRAQFIHHGRAEHNLCAVAHLQPNGVLRLHRPLLLCEFPFQ